MMTTPFRHFGLTLAAALVLTACGGSDPKAAADKTAPAKTEAKADASKAAAGTVNVYNWVEYLPEKLKPEFEAATGIKVNYDTFDTDETLNTKIIAGSSGYDVVVPGAAWGEVQSKQGKYLKLDRTKIPNYKNLDPALMAQVAKMDPNNEHLIPWAWGFTGVGINEDKVKKALGGAALPDNPFDLVFNPKYADKLKSCGMFMLDSPSEIMPAALQYLGKDASSTNLADYKTALDMLTKIRPNVRKFGDSTVINELADGNFCVALMWSGDVNTASARASNPAIKMLLGHGGIVFFDTMAIPADAKNVDNAYAWINNYLEPKNGASITNELGYATANKAALAFVDKEKADNKTIFLSEDNLKQMAPRRLPASEEAVKAMNDSFRKFKTGK